MIRTILTLCAVIFTSPALTVSTANAADINQEVARAYNEGVVRCSNPDCAKYLYACFRSYNANTLQEFLSCGSQASRLNENQLVVAAPSSS